MENYIEEGLHCCAAPQPALVLQQADVDTCRIPELLLLLSIACPDGSRLCIHRLPNHDISEFELSTLSCPIRTEF